MSEQDISLDDNTHDYQNLIDELARQSNEANGILNILSPLVNNGEQYKTLFRDIHEKIENSHQEIKTAKTANTKYLNELKTREELIDNFIESVNVQQNEIKELLKKIGDVEKSASARLITIETLKTNVNDNKKLVTEAKNEVLNLVNSIEKLKEESLILIKELRGEKQESIRITKFLKTKEDEVIKIHEVIDKKYADLFSPNSDGKSKIQKIDEQIKSIGLFNDKLDKEIQKNLDGKQVYLDELKLDIDKKSVQIKSLLSNAIAGALDQGYLESMHEYSIGKKLDYKELSFLSPSFENIGTFLYNHFFRYLSTIINYSIFILPLVGIVFIFFQTESLDKLIDFLKKGSNGPTVSELILLKALISLPLIWISWFGQKSISQRKRLFEEYNHKSRVVRMYIMFAENKNSYELGLRTELENTLLEAIRKNPADSLGSGETIVDKILERIHFGDFYEKIRTDLREDLKSLLK